MVNKVSFYGYLFKRDADKIVRYDILWKSVGKFLLKSTILDKGYRNPTEKITVRLFTTLPKCIATVIGRLRNMEVRKGVYKRLKPVNNVPGCYRAAVHELCSAIETKHISSFSFFGHLCKYNPKTPAKEVLASMGYFVLTTQPPRIYVLHDLVKKEYKNYRKSHNNVCDQ